MLSWHWSRWLGEISFGLYLIHKPVLWLTHGLMLGVRRTVMSVTGALVSALSVAIAVLLAWSLWVLWERRWQALGHRYRYRYD